MSRLRPPFLLLLPATLALAGCGPQQPPAATVPPAAVAAAAATLPGDDEVLARVAGRPVTRYDLTAAAERLTGRSGSPLDPARPGLLDGVVAGRALAAAAERELSPLEAARIERQVAAWRDELLAKRYLAAHATPAPVTDTMVADYYRAHPERFGGGTAERYELLLTESAPAGAQRDELLRAIGTAGGDADWEALVQQWRGRGWPVAFRRGEGDAGLLQEELRRLLAGLAVGEASRPAVVAGRIYRLRLVERRPRPPRPLAEVSAEVRKALLPLRLNEAVQQATAEAMRAVTVERIAAGAPDKTAAGR